MKCQNVILSKRSVSKNLIALDPSTEFIPDSVPGLRMTLQWNPRLREDDEKEK